MADVLETVANSAENHQLKDFIKEKCPVFKVGGFHSTIVHISLALFFNNNDNNNRMVVLTQRHQKVSKKKCKNVQSFKQVKCPSNEG